MPRRHYFAAASTLISSLIWSALLVLIPGEWSVEASVVVGCGLLVMAVVAVAAVLVQGSPLGYWLAVAVVALEAVIAFGRPLAPGWWVGVGAMAVAAVSLVDPSLGGQLRTEPPPAPVPRTASALCLLLLIAAPLTALAAPTARQVALPLLALTAWGILFSYVRLLPGREWWPRLAAPLLAAAGWLLPIPSRWVWMGTLGVVSVLAWTRGVRLAVRPLVESGRTVPIPPELVPPEVLGAAGIDRRGRRAKGRR